MNRIPHALLRVSLAALGLVLGACQDPMPIDATAHPPPPSGPSPLEDCPSSDEWLPNTADIAVSPGLFRPAAHPETECPFYRGGWQTFLMAMQPDTRSQFKGEPLIKSYLTLDNVFERYTPVPAGALNAPGTPQGTSQRAWLGDIKQAGGRQILIDQNGHTLYYGIHVNQAFADFIHENKLERGSAIQNAPERLFFPAGVSEFKTAWQEVDPIAPATDVTEDDPRLATFIHTKAWVPHLSQVTDPTGAKSMVEDRDHPRLVMVRLLAIHSVFTLPGHPEFVWASLEHTNVDTSKGETDTKALDNHRDVAPITPDDPVTHKPTNPDPNDPENTKNTTVVSDADGYLLYKKGTPANLGDHGPIESQLDFDEATQTFTNPAQWPSIYRMFAASKSNETDPDGAITSLNHNVEQLFITKEKQLDPADKRGHYRLLGAQWMDKPAFFDLNLKLQNDSNSPLIKDPAGFPNMNQEEERATALAMSTDPVQTALDDIHANGSDSGFSILAGEDRMSSTAMESFTQDPASFFNCFSCHNTQAITSKGVSLANDSTGVQLLKPKLLNVSHVLSQLILEECMSNLQDNPDSPGGKMAVCPP